MAKLSIKVASTSQTANVWIQDSSSTTGAGLTGLVFNTSSLTAYYALPKAASVAITLATLSAVTSAYSSGGFKEIDATNMPGWYRFDVPDAAIASGRFVSIHLRGATNMAPLPLEIELTATDNQDAVRGGMTAMPNANSAAIGGLPTLGGAIPNNLAGNSGGLPTCDTNNAVRVQTGTGTGQLDFTSGVVKANVTQLLGTAWLTPGVAGTPDVNAKQHGGTAQTGRDIGASVLLSAGTGTGQLDFTSGVVKGNATQWLGGTIPAVNVTGVPIVDLKYTLGTISPATAGSVRADAVTGAVGSVTGAVGSVTAGVTVTTNNDKTGYALTAGEHTAIVSDAQTGLTAQGYTATRAGYLDTLNGLVQAIWDKATSAITTAGSVGKRIVDFVTGDAYARLGAPAGASHAADVAAVKTDTGAIENTVWNATAASHNSAGTTGNKLNSASAAGDPWTASLPGSYAAGSAGAILGGMATLTVSIAAVKVKTDQLTFTVPNRVDANISQQGSGDAPFLAR